LRGRSFASAVGVWRVRAGDRSAILKLLRLNAGPHPRWPSRPDSDDPYYWYREPLAYRSGALEPFGVPRLLACVDRGDGSTALWLEDGGDPVRGSTPERLGNVARRLGTAQRELVGFDASWLAHGWLREYFRLHGLPLDDGVLDRLDALTQTLCHNDLHPDNVLDSGLVIDWAFCGVGPVGADAGVLVGDGLADGWFPPELADDVARAVWAGYAEGLGDDGEDVRFGFVQGIRRLRWYEPMRDFIGRLDG
jgi:Phosphotransferase enzyme family